MDTTSPSKRSRTHQLVRWARRLALGALVIAAVGVVAWSFRPKPLVVDVVTAEHGSMSVRVRADGVTRIKDRYVLSAPAYGQMSRVSLRPGDRVSSGDPLTTITPAPSALLDVRTRAEAESRVESARAAWRQAQTAEQLAGDALEYAESELDRLRNLRERSAASSSQVDAAEFAVRSREADAASAEFATRIARHQLEMAEATLEPETGDDGAAIAVTVPVDGVVLRVLQEHAGIVQPGTPIVEIGDLSALEVVVDVLTSDAVRIEIGAPVTIERWGGQGQLAGHVRGIEPQAFTRLSALGVEEQRVNVVIDLDGDPASWSRIGDGWRVEAGILTWSGEDVLMIPLSTVFRSDGGWAVYSVRGGVVELTPIELGHRDGRSAEVLSGLAPGAQVVAYPSDAIGAGMMVEVAGVGAASEGSVTSEPAR